MIHFLTAPYLDSSPFDVLLPLKHLWEVAFVNSLTALLNYLFVHLQTMQLIATIGAYGVAIVVLTIMIRLALAPLQQFQLVTQRKTMVEQRKLGPEVAELRKKFKKDPQKLNAEMMKLYQEHGVNPLGGLVGCLPLVVQMPILTALYWVFWNKAHASHVVASHFLFLPNLNDTPQHLLSVNSIGLAIAYLVFPVLAAVTTFVQSRMLQMPPVANPTEQEAQTQQMTRMMVWMSPLMIGYFALQVPAGLGLYWFIGNCVSIIQQSFVTGWGGLLGHKSPPPAPPPGRQGFGKSPNKDAGPKPKRPRT